MTRPEPRPLRDAPDRSYAAKLDRFTQFAAPELRDIFSGLRITRPGLVLDLGCGTGIATAILANELGPDHTVIGLDLSLPHLQSARRQHSLGLIQGDADKLCFQADTFDLIWCCNTINHSADAVACVRSLCQCLKKGGQLILAQSGFLPEMFFAWDAHLDDAIRLACHRYYRDRYELSLTDTAAIRGLLRMLQATELTDITASTRIIERIQPLSAEDRSYFQQAVFEEVWLSRIRGLLGADDRRKLDRNCDPASPDYCLDRPDFHHIQTITVCSGRKAA